MPTFRAPRGTRDLLPDERSKLARLEAIGDPGPGVDAELIELGLTFYREVGLPDVQVLLNTIGDPTCRPAYLTELTAYYQRHLDALPDTERARLETNPLRLLDSKAPAMA